MPRGTATPPYRYGFSFFFFSFLSRCFFRTDRSGVRSLHSLWFIVRGFEFRVPSSWSSILGRKFTISFDWIVAASHENLTMKFQGHGQIFRANSLRILWLEMLLTLRVSERKRESFGEWFWSSSVHAAGGNVLRDAFQPSERTSALAVLQKLGQPCYPHRPRPYTHNRSKLTERAFEGNLIAKLLAYNESSSTTWFKIHPRPSPILAKSIIDPFIFFFFTAFSTSRAEIYFPRLCRGNSTFPPAI